MSALRSLPLLRRAVFEDLPEVAVIERASFSDPWTAETFASTLSLPHIRFLVAEDSDDLRGGADSAMRRRGGGRSLLGYVVALMAADEGEIADLAVAPPVRRRGVGGALLDRVTDEARASGIRSLYLEVRESNLAAMALYRSRGFDTVGRRRGYYRHPVEDALVLKRDLGAT